MSHVEGVRVGERRACRIQRAPGGLVDDRHAKCLWQRPQPPLPVVEQRTRRGGGRRHPEDERQRSEAVSFLQRHGVDGRLEPDAEEFEQHRGHEGRHVASRDDREFRVSRQEAREHARQRAVGLDGVVRRAHGHPGRHRRKGAAGREHHDHIPRDLRETEHRTMEKRRAGDLGRQLVRVTEPRRPTAGEDDPGDRAGGRQRVPSAPPPRSRSARRFRASGSSPLRFCTNWKPNRPLMHRCPLVT